MERRGTERQRWLSFFDAFLAPINVASNSFCPHSLASSSLAILPSIRFTLLPLQGHSSIV